ncbi:hypothetical protein GCM10027038_08320 [Arthrobacter bambusae]
MSWLAGIISWAGAAQVKGPLRELLAAACFFGYRSSMVRLVRAGQVWHADLELLLLVIPVGRPARSSGAVLWGGLGALALVSVLRGIFPTFGMIAYSVLVVLVLIWLIPAFIALPFLLSRNMRRANAAVKAWNASSSEQAYNVACLTKHDDVAWGSGVPFARKALMLALPPGTPILAVASKPKEVRFLRALGFTALEYKGVATRAMVRRT